MSLPAAKWRLMRRFQYTDAVFEEGAIAEGVDEAALSRADRESLRRQRTRQEGSASLIPVMLGGKLRFVLVGRDVQLDPGGTGPRPAR